MKKTIFIMLIVVMCIVAYIAFNYNSYKMQALKASKLNMEYENFTENEILGTSLITLINKAVDSNEKNNVNKNNSGRYIDNNENSIQIEVKFLEADETFDMEAINKLGAEQFIKNYGAIAFKCTKKEYHKTTNNIKYLLFEQTEIGN